MVWNFKAPLDVRKGRALIASVRFRRETGTRRVIAILSLSRLFLFYLSENCEKSRIKCVVRDPDADCCSALSDYRLWFFFMCGKCLKFFLTLRWILTCFEFYKWSELWNFDISKSVLNAWCIVVCCIYYNLNILPWHAIWFKFTWIELYKYQK